MIDEIQKRDKKIFLYRKILQISIHLLCKHRATYWTIHTSRRNVIKYPLNSYFSSQASNDDNGKHKREEWNLFLYVFQLLAACHKRHAKLKNCPGTIAQFKMDVLEGTMTRIILEGLLNVYRIYNRQLKAYPIIWKKKREKKWNEFILSESS